MVLIRKPDLQNTIVRYYQQLDYTALVINNNNLFLIDSHFENFVHNNALGFRLNKDGMMDMGYIINPELRLTLKSQFTGKKTAFQNIKTICKSAIESD